MQSLQFIKIKTSDFKVVIIGRGTQKESLQKFCSEKKLNNVIFLDYVPNDQLYKYYSVADAVVVPSVTTPIFKEPWGLIVNEAMNQTTVVIASDAVGAAAGGLIKNGENGIIVPEGNPNILANAIEEILSDEEYQKQLAFSAKKTIEGWTYDKMARGFIDAVSFASKE